MNDCMKHAKAIAEELEAVINEESEEYEDIYDYMENVLDVEYRIDSQGDLIAAEMYITVGGPAIWIDTLVGTVEVRWGMES